MSKVKWLKITNPILGAAMLVLIVTGIGHEHMSHRTFVHWHMLGGVVTAVLSVVHTVLNWGWFRSSYFGKTAGR